MKIKPLPEDVINKIAAGEIVDRPASVLKELIENSIDAKASKIDIFIEKAGKRLIKVVDNGEGIEREDLINAVKKHHTSKIKSFEDLYNILTFGFRGEALSSIANVSKLSITSRTPIDITAGQLIVEAGNVVSLSEVGHPIGTTVEVRNIFFNLPARWKFLKSDNTENYHIVSTFLNYVISNPNIHFTLTLDSRQIYNFFPSDLRTRVKEILTDIYNEVVEIEYENFTGKVRGYVSLKKWKKNFLFVNSRPVKNSMIYKFLRDILGEGFYFINLELPPYFYDINIHPTKIEVKFQKESEVISLIKTAIDKSLKPKSSVSFFELNQPKTNYKTQDNFEIIGYIENTFIVAYYKSEIYFIDAHVANERVMYEILKKTIQEKGYYRYQKLISQVEIEISEEDKSKLFQIKGTLNKLGFRFDIKDKLYITAIPDLMDTGKAIQSLWEILKEDITDTDNIISKISCRMSIMSGDSLTLQQAKELLSMWIKTDNPHLCPHGRPIYYKLSVDVIKQAVGRK
ncbi:MAG: DNA mismatch repair endonuclease MutL [Hydrogenothermaceae bacterium]